MLTIHSSLLAVDQSKSEQISLLNMREMECTENCGNQERLLRSDSEVNSEEYTQVTFETVISAPMRYSQASMKVKCYMVVGTGSAFHTAAWKKDRARKPCRKESFAFHLANSFHPFIYYTNNLFTVR